MKIKTYHIQLLLFVKLMISNIFSQNLDFYNQSHAIIIGINDYISESITDLNYAQQDAESIANLLVNSLGSEIIL